jgi:diaminopimelate decarboxylase
MTFDSVEELHKIKVNYPDAHCVLRITTTVTTAVYNLNEKYGIDMEDV